MEETAVESEIPASKGKKKREAEDSRESSSDLRALLLILVLAVIVFFILLYKQRHPQEYAESVVRAKEGADAAYAKAEEVLPGAYRGVGGFFEYVFDYGKTADLPPELPKVRFGSGSVIGETSVTVSSGSLSFPDALSDTGAEDASAASSGSRVTETPLVVEFSGYRLEFDRPPIEAVAISIGGAKMTVGPAVREKQDNSAK